MVPTRNNVCAFSSRVLSGTLSSSGVLLFCSLIPNTEAENISVSTRSSDLFWNATKSFPASSVPSQGHQQPWVRREGWCNSSCQLHLIAQDSHSCSTGTVSSYLQSSWACTVAPLLAVMKQGDVLCPLIVIYRHPCWFLLQSPPLAWKHKYLTGKSMASHTLPGLPRCTAQIVCNHRNTET